MPGHKNLTREGRRDKKQEEDEKARKDKRPSSVSRPSNSGSHDMTIISSDSSDEEQPSAKIPKPKTGGFREAITKAYNRKVEETKSRRAIDGKSGKDNMDYDIQKMGSRWMPLRLHLLHRSSMRKHPPFP